MPWPSTNPYAEAFFLDWDTIAKDMVGALRTQAGRDPSDRGLSNLIGELATRSDSFAARWARHEVRLHRTARRRLGNRVVGEIELTGNALDLAGDGLAMIAYSPPNRAARPRTSSSCWPPGAPQRVPPPRRPSGYRLQATNRLTLA